MKSILQEKKINNNKTTKIQTIKHTKKKRKKNFKA
jgi:hypothetical protein